MNISLLAPSCGLKMLTYIILLFFNKKESYTNYLILMNKDGGSTSSVNSEKNLHKPNKSKIYEKLDQILSLDNKIIQHQQLDKYKVVNIPNENYINEYIKDSKKQLKEKNSKVNYINSSEIKSTILEESNSQDDIVEETVKEVKKTTELTKKELDKKSIEDKSEKDNEEKEKKDAEEKEKKDAEKKKKDEERKKRDKERRVKQIEEDKKSAKFKKDTLNTKDEILKAIIQIDYSDIHAPLLGYKLDIYGKTRHLTDTDDSRQKYAVKYLTDLVNNENIDKYHKLDSTYKLFEVSVNKKYIENFSNKEKELNINVYTKAILRRFINGKNFEKDAIIDHIEQLETDDTKLNKLNKLRIYKNKMYPKGNSEDTDLFADQDIIKFFLRNIIVEGQYIESYKDLELVIYNYKNKKKNKIILPNKSYLNFNDIYHEEFLNNLNILINENNMSSNLVKYVILGASVFLELACIGYAVYLSINCFKPKINALDLVLAILFAPFYLIYRVFISKCN